MTSLTSSSHHEYVLTPHTSIRSILTIQIAKGTSSFGKRHNKSHTLCRRCGELSIRTIRWTDFQIVSRFQARTLIMFHFHRPSLSSHSKAHLLIVWLSRCQNPKMYAPLLLHIVACFGIECFFMTYDWLTEHLDQTNGVRRQRGERQQGRAE